MELAKSLCIVLFSAILVDNFVLSKFMGCCPFLGVSKNLNSAFGMSCAVTFVMVMATPLPIRFTPICWILTVWGIWIPSPSSW